MNTNKIWISYPLENADEFGATGLQYCSERVKRILDELKVKSMLIYNLIARVATKEEIY